MSQQDTAERLACFVLVEPLRLRLLAGGGVSVAPRDVPHSPQNLACGAFAKPHWVQRRLSEVPHSLQNFSPSGFSKPQLAQCMVPLYSSSLCGARKTLEP